MISVFCRVVLELVLIFIFCYRSEGSYGYSYADCTYLKGNENYTHYGGRCFCYSSGTVIKWKDIWSTFQVRVTGDDGVGLVYPMETRNCREPDDIIMLSKCVFDHYWPSSSTVEKSLDIPLVDQDVCFMVKSKKPSVQYTLQVAGKQLNRLHFSLFIIGVGLFYFAGALCRSSLIYYSAGVSLGIISIFIFLLFVVKNFIPKRGVFLMLFGASSGLSYLGFQQLLANWEEVMSMYWREVLGYLLVSGFISFAVCYKCGPIRDERTLVLMTWVLQIVAMGMVYHGITYRTASYAVPAVLLGLRCIPHVCRLLLAICRQTLRLLGSALGLLGKLRWWGRRRVRLLTEDEYREQGDSYTRAALEALRQHCSSADFPAWDTVLRLRSPQRFASFLRGGSHLTPEESQTHDLQYGLGGAYYEGMIFTGRGRGPPPTRAPPQRGGGDDLSEDEPEYYETSHILPPPVPFRSPAPLHSPAPPRSPTPSPALPPYPALPYTPHSDPTATEELELF